MKEKLKDLLDLNNSFYTFCKKIGWVFLMNLLFIITSIPVITIGASATAMYTVFNKMIDEREFSFFGDYFRAFRDNFLISTAVWLPELLITAALFLNTLYVFNSMSGAFGIIMRIGTVLLLIANALIANMLFPLIARFDITIKELIPTVFQMLTEHPGTGGGKCIIYGCDLWRLPGNHPVRLVSGAIHPVPADFFRTSCIYAELSLQKAVPLLYGRGGRRSGLCPRLQPGRTGYIFRKTF